MAPIPEKMKDKFRSMKSAASVGMGLKRKKMAEGGVVSSVESDGSRHGKFEENEPMESNLKENYSYEGNYSEAEPMEKDIFDNARHFAYGGNVEVEDEAGGNYDEGPENADMRLADKEYPTRLEEMEQIESRDAGTKSPALTQSSDESAEKKRMFAGEVMRKLSANRRGSMGR